MAKPVADAAPLLTNSAERDIASVLNDTNVPKRSLDVTAENSCAARIPPTSAGDAPRASTSIVAAHELIPYFVKLSQQWQRYVRIAAGMHSTITVDGLFLRCSSCLSKASFPHSLIDPPTDEVTDEVTDDGSVESVCCDDERLLMEDRSDDVDGSDGADSDDLKERSFLFLDGNDDNDEDDDEVRIPRETRSKERPVAW